MIEAAFWMSALAIALSFLALVFALRHVHSAFVNGRKYQLRVLGDPTSYTVVTDGKFFRIRGPFDTFYTMKFRNKQEAEEYAKQLSHYYGSVFNEQNWRAA